MVSAASRSGILSLKIVGIIFAVVALAVALMPAGHVAAQPSSAPIYFYGTLLADGSPAEVGTEVRAVADGVVIGSIITDVEGVYADIYGPLGAVAPEGATVIEFWAGDPGKAGPRVS